MSDVGEKAIERAKLKVFELARAKAIREGIDVGTIAATARMTVIEHTLAVVTAAMSPERDKPMMERVEQSMRDYWDAVAQQLQQPEKVK